MTMPRTERLQHYINQGYKEKSVLIRRVAETAVEYRQEKNIRCGQSAQVMN